VHNDWLNLPGAFIFRLAVGYTMFIYQKGADKRKRLSIIGFVTLTTVFATNIYQI